MKRAQLVMSEEAYGVLEQIASERDAEMKKVGKRYFVSDLMREAITAEVERAGKSIDFGVERGGYRRGQQDDEQQ